MLAPGSMTFRCVPFSREQCRAGPTAAVLVGTAVLGCKSTREAPRVPE